MAQSLVRSHSHEIVDAQGILVRYGDTLVLDKVSLRVVTGSTLVILGNSGCGKTTLLKVLAGSIKPCEGSVLLDGQELQTVAVSKRGSIYLDQESLLFDHLDVYENVAFALRLRRLPEPEVDAQVRQMLSRISLAEHARKKSHQLSGGQKQRVAFARAILATPKVLLLDEPFGSLDERTRTMMQELYKELCGEFGITAVFVTHDVKEALLVGDAFGYMDHGKLHGYASREDFMNDPRTGVMQEILFWQTVQSRQVT